MTFIMIFIIKFKIIVFNVIEGRSYIIFFQSLIGTPDKNILFLLFGCDGEITLPFVISQKKKKWLQLIKLEFELCLLIPSFVLITAEIFLAKTKILIERWLSPIAVVLDITFQFQLFFSFCFILLTLQNKNKINLIWIFIEIFFFFKFSFDCNKKKIIGYFTAFRFYWKQKHLPTFTYFFFIYTCLKWLEQCKFNISNEFWLPNSNLPLLHAAFNN